MRTRYGLLAALVALVLAACTQTADPVDVNDVALDPEPGAEALTVEDVSATFLLALDESEITDEMFTLESADEPVAGSISYDAETRTLTFTPDEPLEGATTYTATISEDLPFEAEARSLDEPIVWEFTTAETPGDETPGDETPGDETPGDETPGDETPGDETPGDETPGDEEPTDVTFTIEDTTYVYDATPHTVTVTSTPADVDYTVTYELDGVEVEEPTEVGTYDVTVESADPEFEGTETAELVISPIALTVTADDKGKDYGEPDPELTFALTGGSLLEGDAFTGSLTREAGEDVGTYTITQGTLSAGENYDITFESSDLEIFTRELTATAVAEDKVYDGTVDASADVTLTGVVDGDDVEPTYFATFDTPDVGEDKTVTITGIDVTGDDASNYSVSPNEITATADIVALEVVSTSPTGTGASPDTEIVVTFNGNVEDMEIDLALFPCASTVNNANGFCTGYGDEPIAGTASIEGDTFTFTPSGGLEGSISDGTFTDSHLWHEATVDVSADGSDLLDDTWEFRVN